mmetsp:Transcript_6629/g.10635  ORF Transcript_6629/g.10635 Transcript_6629/m.10635 type:complete len:171 (+) Transcript_6629:41-553(+)
METSRLPFLLALVRFGLLASAAEDDAQKVPDFLRVMDAVDANKDMKVTLDELQEHAGNDPHLFKEWAAAFAESDADADGVLSVEEFEAFVKHEGDKPDGEAVESILAKLDVDKDGKISLKELLDASGDSTQDLESGFKRADTDKDGLLTRDEIAILFELAESRASPSEEL